MDARARAPCARSTAIRIGAATSALAEESASVRGTWYAPEEILELVRAAGFRDARTEPLPFAADAEGETFALVASA